MGKGELVEAMGRVGIGKGTGGGGVEMGRGWERDGGREWGRGRVEIERGQLEMRRGVEM